MDDPRQESEQSRNEKVLKYEVFDPEVSELKEIKGFTNGNKYPIYEEKIVEIGYPVWQQDLLSLHSSVKCRTINDEGKMVWLDSRYFYLQIDLWEKYEDCLDVWKKQLSQLEIENSEVQSTIRAFLTMTECNVRQVYRQQEKHVPFEDYMAIIPIWRTLSGLTENVSTTEQLQAMDKSLVEFVESAHIMRAKIKELLVRRV